MSHSSLGRDGSGANSSAFSSLLDHRPARHPVLGCMGWGVASSCRRQSGLPFRCLPELQGVVPPRLRQSQEL
eukprot:109388-Amphidinium_carterae.1